MGGDYDFCTINASNLLSKYVNTLKDTQNLYSKSIVHARGTYLLSVLVYIVIVYMS